MGVGDGGEVHFDLSPISLFLIVLTPNGIYASCSEVVIVTMC